MQVTVDTTARLSRKEGLFPAVKLSLFNISINLLPLSSASVSSTLPLIREDEFPSSLCFSFPGCLRP